MIGTVAAPPVGPPAVIVLVRVTGIVTAAEPLKAALVPVAAPETEIVRPVVRVAALPVVLFAKVALEASTIWEEALVPTMVLEAGTAAPLTATTVVGIEMFAEPLKLVAVPTASPLVAMVRGVVRVAADPVVDWFHVGTVPVRLE
jgi:hypothetical protein